MSNMLIDGKNCVYPSVYAGLSSKTFLENRHHPAVILFRFITSYVKKHNPRSVHIFWDADKESLWRKKIYQPYKENRAHKNINGYDVDDLVRSVISVCKSTLPLLGVKSYELGGEEADDLIYAFCKVFQRQRHIIISSDGDFKQLAYYFSNVTLYDPLNDKIVNNIDSDPVENKCLQGENGDNIDGYPRVGKVTAKSLCEDINKKIEFLNANGNEIYLRNRLLIDMSMCPHVHNNMLYIQKEYINKRQFDRKLFIETLYNQKVRGIAPEINNIIRTFRLITEEES